MGFPDRERTIAPPGFNGWLVPAAALAVHLCIGQAYATSVYKTALVKHFGASQRGARLCLQSRVTAMCVGGRRCG